MVVFFQLVLISVKQLPGLGNQLSLVMRLITWIRTKHFGIFLQKLSISLLHAWLRLLRISLMPTLLVLFLIALLTLEESFWSMALQFSLYVANKVLHLTIQLRLYVDKHRRDFCWIITFFASIDNKKLKSALEVVSGRHLLSFEDITKVATFLSRRWLAW